MEDEATDIARIICARTMSGFCRHVGGDLGCKVGRGTSDYTQCIADEGQLILSGHMGLAKEIKAKLDAPTP